MARTKGSTTGTATMVCVKFSDEMLKKIDAWMKRKAKLNRSDAVRELVAKGLGLDPGPKDLPAWVSEMQEWAQDHMTEMGADNPFEVVKKLDERLSIGIGPAVVAEPAPPLPPKRKSIFGGRK